MNENHEFLEDQLIILTKPILDLFLKHDNPSDLIALYTFYYYTAKWQKTNQPKCTDEYVQNGLHWSYGRLRKTKKILMELKLIEQIINKNNNGKIQGYYIKIRYILKQETTNPVLLKCSSGNPSTNALSINNLNALSINNREELENSSKNENLKEEKKEINYPIEFLNLIKMWNSLPRIASKHKNLQSKTVQNAYKYYRWLKKGIFLKNTCIEIDELERNNIPIEDHKYTDQEIIKGLENVFLQYENGYYPFELKDKKRILQKSLETAFFSLYGCPSAFLKCYYNSPKCRQDLIKLNDDDYPELTDLLKKEVFSDKSNWTIQENNILITGISDWWKKIEEVNQEKIKSTYEDKYYTRIEMDILLFKNASSIQKFIDNFIWFIKNTREVWEKLQTDVRMFKNDFWWNKFCEWLKQEFDLDLFNCDMKILRLLYEKELIKSGKIKVKEKSLKEQLREINQILENASKDSPSYLMFLEDKKDILNKIKKEKK